jgi:hypothetical protein
MTDEGCNDACLYKIHSLLVYEDGSIRMLRTPSGLGVGIGGVSDLSPLASSDPSKAIHA